MLFAASAVVAQDECVFDTNPGMSGVFLDSPVSEVNTALKGDLKVKVKQNGERTFFKNWLKRPAKGRLQGVRALYLRFLDGILYQIEIFYNDGVGGNDLESFLGYVSKENGFPRDKWKVTNGYAKFSCDGFSFEADRVLNPHVQISIEAVVDEVKALRTKN